MLIVLYLMLFHRTTSLDLKTFHKVMSYTELIKNYSSLILVDRVVDASLDAFWVECPIRHRLLLCLLLTNSSLVLVPATAPTTHWLGPTPMSTERSAEVDDGGTFKKPWKLNRFVD